MKHTETTTTKEESLPTETLDPVCGMTVDPQDAAGELQVEGKRYLFCSKSCLNQFQAAPEKYINASAQAASTKGSAPSREAEAADFTCPMHPDVHKKRDLARSVEWL